MSQQGMSRGLRQQEQGPVEGPFVLNPWALRCFPGADDAFPAVYPQVSLSRREEPRGVKRSRAEVSGEDDSLATAQEPQLLSDPEPLDQR